MRAPPSRRSRPGRRTLAATALLAMLAGLAARPDASFASDAPVPAEADATLDGTTGAVDVIDGTDTGDWPLALTPPRLIGDPVTGPSAGHGHHLVAPHGELARTHLVPGDPVLLSLDVSMRYVRLMVTGDHRPGLSPFLGTSAAALGGLRLRF